MDGKTQTPGSDVTHEGQELREPIRMRIPRLAWLASVAAAATIGCTSRDAAGSSERERVVDSVNAATADSAKISADSAAALPPPADVSGQLSGETTKQGGTMGQRDPPDDSLVSPGG